MKKRFIVSIKDTTKEKDELFLNYIKESGMGWWHYIDNFWLLTDNSGKQSASIIRDQINIIYESRSMVLELSENSENWAGFGPKNENQNMFDWIEKYWKK